MNVDAQVKVRCDMKVKAEAKMRWDKDQAKWDRRQAKWDARQSRWEARQAHYQERQAHWGERQAHWDKSREEWEQIGKLVVSALTLAVTAGIAGLKRLESREQPGSTPPAEQPLKQPLAAQASPDAMGRAILGAGMILVGVLWLLSMNGGALFGGLLVVVAVIAVLGIVISAARRAGRAPSSALDELLAAARRATNASIDSPASAASQSAASASVDPPASAASPLASKLMSILQPAPTEVKRDPVYYRRRAKDYRLRIQRILKSRRRGPLTDAMAAAAQNVQRWEERVGQLVDRLTTFEKDGIIQRDLREVPRDITRLRKLSQAETDPEIRQQMARTLAGFEAQQRLLDTLVRLMRRTRLQLDDTLAAMGTIYSQVQVLDAMDIASAKTTRIAEEIDEQVIRLNDLLSALGDAYGSSGASDPADAADAPAAAVSQNAPRQDHAAG